MNSFDEEINLKQIMGLSSSYSHFNIFSETKIMYKIGNNIVIDNFVDNNKIFIKKQKIEKIDGFALTYDKNHIIMY